MDERDAPGSAPAPFWKSCFTAFRISGVLGVAVGGLLSMTDAKLVAASVLAVPALPFLRLLPDGVWPLGLPIILASAMGYALIGSFFWLVASSIALEVRNGSAKNKKA